MTSSDKSVLSLLEVRDRRQDSLSRILSKGYPATVFLSLNIPGFEKAPPGSGALFALMLNTLFETLAGLLLHERADDLLGPYAILSLDMDPLALKKHCIALESTNPSARLIDLDVYSASAVQIDRASLGVAARNCLICPCPAVECMRMKRHTFDQVLAKTHELLSPFRP